MAAISPDRMTFLEHLDELRVRLMHSLAALVVGTIVCWGFHERIFHFLTQPLRNAYPAVKFIVHFGACGSCLQTYHASAASAENDRRFSSTNGASGIGAMCSGTPTRSG